MTGIFKNTIKMTMAVFFIASMTLTVATGYARDNGAMNPCSANPCAKKMNPCAKKMNPCAMKHNPCAKKMNPCAMKHNPCAKKMNPCAMKHNPCAKKMNPCAMKHNPCAAKHNPCAANPCGGNPCASNPCSPAEISEISDKEAAKIYKKMAKSLHVAYAKSGLKVAKQYYKWSRFNKVPYVSDTHGSRLVNNYSNRSKYGKYEKAGKMKTGTITAKDSFRVSPSGKVEPGPLFIMEKMKAGFDSENGDWRYSMVMPDGSIFGTSKGKGAEYVEFCASCHNAAEDNDMMFFIPEEYRK